MTDLHELAEEERRKERLAKEFESKNRYPLMKTLFWFVLAKILSLPFVTRYLVLRAKQTPYRHLSGYMYRWWLIREQDDSDFAVRIHHILRRDNDRHMHNHPWEFRSVILSGWYVEEYLDDLGNLQERTHRAGSTYFSPKGYYHRIKEVSPGGVRTLFITFKRNESWGFLVDGEHILSDVYLAERRRAASAMQINTHAPQADGQELPA